MDNIKNPATIVKLSAVVLTFILLISVFNVIAGISNSGSTVSSQDLSSVIQERKLTEEQIKKAEETRSKRQKEQMDSEEVKVAVTIIKKSGVFGSPPKPRPSSLIGIAENVAFIQTPSGSVQGIEIGQTIQNVKVIKIDTNRVLIEENGKQRELTIYSGMGSETLIGKEGK